MSEAVPIVPGAGRGEISVSNKKKLLTILLCIFLGYLGVHRFYVGKVWTGLIWFLTGGLVGIGVIVDAVLILISAFRDKEGNVLKEWT